jgi:Ca-activated chloride channel family protein
MPIPAPPTHGLVVMVDDAPDGIAAVPLTGVDVHARIAGACARVRVRQTYENDTETPLEATYLFPLEEGSAVCGFRVTIDGHVLHGKVESRDEAFDQYDDAMAEGKTALLLDQERPDVFTVSVGNLLPRQELTVELEYVAEVPREGEALRWRLPTTVSPRYVPESHRDFDGMNDAERLGPPLVCEALPYQLHLAVDVDLGTRLKTVESPSHKTRVEMHRDGAHVELTGDEGLMDRDFVLLLRPEDRLAPLAALEEGPDGQLYAVVSFWPVYDAPRDPAEIVFVVDCSGSMQGDSIEQARKTLRLCLRSLETGDHFNVIQFGSSFELYEKQSPAYDDDSLRKADSWLKKMQAVLGGTEMAAPLSAAFGLPRIEGVGRRIVLITDGQVSNENELIHLAKQHSDETQVFAFGVGYGASEHLVRGVARAGRGAAEMIYPGETIDDKVLRHFQRMTGRPLSNVELSFEGVEVADVLPREMPPLWANEPVTFFLRTCGAENGSARLSAKIDGRELRLEAPLTATPSSGSSAAAVPMLWARRRIREIEESDPWTLRRGSLQNGRKGKKIEARRKEVERQLVEIGRTFGLVSSATSYVLIDDRPAAGRADARARLVRVPGQLTRGWHGVGDLHADVAMSMGTTGLRSRAMGLFKAAVAGPTDFMSTMSDLESEVPSAAPPRDPMDALALQITADGYWTHSPEVFRVTGFTKARVQELSAALGIPQAAELVTTLAVLTTLERRSRVPASWKPLLAKARKWVRKTTAGIQPPGGATWEEWLVGKDC